MEGTKRLTVTVPLSVHAKLAALARREKRSLQSQVEWLLERAVSGEGQPIDAVAHHAQNPAPLSVEIDPNRPHSGSETTK